MLCRFKFRIHDGSKQGKFFFNVQDGTTLYLDDCFQPVPQEFAYYGLFLRNGRTSVAFLKSPMRWNNEIVQKGPVELRPGHTLWANGKNVEILECPASVVASADPEVTKFLDIRDTKSGATEVSTTVPVDTSVTPPAAPSVASEPWSGEVKASDASPEGADSPDKIVVPISATPPPPPSSKGKPAGRKFPEIRYTDYKKPAMVATLLVALIVVAHEAGKRIQLDLDDGGPDPFSLVVNVPNRRPPRAVPRAQRGPASADTQVPRSAEEIARITTSRELGQAIEEGNLSAVRKLIEEGEVNPDFVVDDLGRTPFVRAAAHARLSILQYLMSLKVSPTVTDFSGTNALMWSVINGHEQTAQYLLSLGLDPQARRDDGKTALQLAQEYHRVSLVKLLWNHRGARKDRMPASSEGRRAGRPSTK